MMKLILFLAVCSFFLALSQANGENNCGSDKDCNVEKECCASEANVDFRKSTIDTSITWKCKKKGYNVGDICNALGNQHCPCAKGFACKPFSGTWFFGNGYCARAI